MVLKKMIAEDRDCVSVVMQLAAVRSSIEGIGALVLNNCTKLCFYKGANATTDIDSLSRAVAIWGRVRGSDSKWGTSYQVVLAHCNAEPPMDEE